MNFSIKPKRFLILLIIALVILALGIYSFFRPLRPIDEKVYAAEPHYEYGILVDSFAVIKDVVKANQSLSDILLPYHIDANMVSKLAVNSSGVFDLRKIRAGNSYTMLCTNDTMRKAKYFIYEHSPTDYVVFDLGDSLRVYAGEKEVKVKIVSSSGVITSSLWKAMTDAKADPNLAISLSEIYQWTIDFYAIQKGDEFKAIYEELYIGNESIGLGKILAAWFRHGGKHIYAYRFVQDSAADYFDDEAASLRRSFLKAPLKFSRISSKFSNSRFHPVLRIRRPHHGVDYAAPRGTPVHAIGNGTVIAASFAGGAGRLIKIRHNATYTTAYMHLAAFAKGIRSGGHVSQGQVIGYVGSSGLSTGPHLDFRFYRNGAAIDPLKVESPPAEPVKNRYLPAFDSLRVVLKKNLDFIRIN
jgi:murein DD-endopeptidase MepM/ murein hydrolase activator NlpD